MIALAAAAVLAAADRAEEPIQPVAELAPTRLITDSPPIQTEADPAPTRPAVALEPAQAAVLSIVPGLGHWASGRPAVGLAYFGLVAVPWVMTRLDVGPRVFADQPAVSLPLWSLTAQTVWAVQLQQAYQDAPAPSLSEIQPRPYSAVELAATPFQPAQLSDWRIWALTLGSEAFSLAMDLALSPERFATPPVWQAHSATIAGVPTGAAAGYGVHALGSALASTQAAVGEEAAFRGYMQTELSRSFGPWIGLGATSALFGLAHVGGANPAPWWRQFGETGLIGLGYGVLYMQEYDLAKPIAAHTYYDVVELLRIGLWPTATGWNVFGIGYGF